jgi:DNA-binding response OmpR family regulator
MSRVLVVEDDADIRALIAARLKLAGHSVRAVADARSALSCVDEGAVPEVMVLDVGLPDMDGFELLEQLRARPESALVPAIFLSARVQEADVERGRRMGATYLTKPFVATSLLESVREAAGSEPVSTW